MGRGHDTGEHSGRSLLYGKRQRSDHQLAITRARLGLQGDVKQALRASERGDDGPALKLLYRHRHESDGLAGRLLDPLEQLLAEKMISQLERALERPWEVSGAIRDLDQEELLLLACGELGSEIEAHALDQLPDLGLAPELWSFELPPGIEDSLGLHLAQALEADPDSVSARRVQTALASDRFSSLAYQFTRLALPEWWRKEQATSPRYNTSPASCLQTFFANCGGYHPDGSTSLSTEELAGVRRDLSIYVTQAARSQQDLRALVSRLRTSIAPVFASLFVERIARVDPVTQAKLILGVRYKDLERPAAELSTITDRTADALARTWLDPAHSSHAEARAAVAEQAFDFFNFAP